MAGFLRTLGSTNQYPSSWCGRSWHFTIGDLHILRAIYEELLPSNEDLVGHNKYPATVAELMRIHAELCEFHKLDHFYREYLVYFAYGEQTNSDKEKVKTKKRSTLHISYQKQMADLNVTAEGSHKAINVCNCCVDGFWERISLAPMVLGSIYHGLGETASDPDHPSKANAIFPNHYVAGWLVELFSRLYRRRPYSDCPGDFPTLARYVGLLRSKLSLPQAKHFFRDGRYLSLRASFNREESRDGTIEICWLSSKIEEIFGVVDTAVKIEELVDVDRVKALSDQDLTCSSEIAHIEDQLNNLSSKASKLKAKEQEVKADLADAKFSKLQDLEKEKNHPKSLIGSVISFNNV
ncbi:hypothetical protein Cgig2_008567 [Carnegiea gigantea]|uniref:Aminotransferase-like plant mobile domain-containing protein n=1 Tax=Carnegiea gigantea TaxID=171969 RepID=A0A9Q1GNR7_9CARY|nr:hypothetical protein Cgig2_008567 [Carnegiea gigantea]